MFVGCGALSRLKMDLSRLGVKIVLQGKGLIHNYVRMNVCLTHQDYKSQFKFA